jgi:hypothetical protein
VIRVYDAAGNVIETHEHWASSRSREGAKQEAATRFNVTANCEMLLFLFSKALLIADDDLRHSFTQLKRLTGVRLCTHPN